MAVNVVVKKEYIMNKKNLIILFIICLVLSGCKKKVINNNELKRTRYAPTETNYQIKKENLYGCWQNKYYDIYDGNNVLFTSRPRLLYKFDEKKVEFCYYNENDKIECNKYDYSISNNIITINMPSDFSETTQYDMVLEDYKEDKATLYFSYVDNGNEHRYYLSLNNDCVLPENN